MFDVFHQQNTEENTFPLLEGMFVDLFMSQICAAQTPLTSLCWKRMPKSTHKFTLVFIIENFFDFS